MHASEALKIYQDSEVQKQKRLAIESEKYIKMTLKTIYEHIGKVAEKGEHTCFIEIPYSTNQQKNAINIIEKELKSNGYLITLPTISSKTQILLKMKISFPID